MDGFVAGYREVFTPVPKPSSGGRPAPTVSTCTPTLAIKPKGLVSGLLVYGGEGGITLGTSMCLALRAASCAKRLGRRRQSMPFCRTLYTRVLIPPARHKRKRPPKRPFTFYGGEGGITLGTSVCLALRQQAAQNGYPCRFVEPSTRGLSSLPHATNTKGLRRGLLHFMAEREGFEPS